MLRNIMKRTLGGMSYGCFWFVGLGIISEIFHFDAVKDGLTSNFISQGFGSMIVGVGFVVPTIVYESEKLSTPVKMLIHLGIGFSIYFPFAVGLGWIPVNLRFLNTLILALIIVAFSIIIWFCFYLYYSSERKRINDRLKTINKDIEN